MKPTAPRLSSVRGPSARSSWPFVSAFEALPTLFKDSGAACRGSEERATPAGRDALTRVAPHGNHGDNTSSATSIRLELNP